MTSDKKYKNAVDWIKKQREDRIEWSLIENCCAEGENRYAALMKLRERMIAPKNMTLEEWSQLVREVRARYTEYSELPINGIFCNDGDEIQYDIPKGERDAWTIYEKMLRGEIGGQRRMSDISVNDMKANCHWIMNRLRKDTRSSGTRKGLVMGSVQSGKTANMIGLTTMVAHYDWNFIVVLSGTIENLRIQTKNRFMRDLPDCRDVDWHFLESCTNGDYLKDTHICSGGEEAKEITINELKLNVSEPDTTGVRYYHQAYVMICLKQASRLEKLISWLSSNESYSNRIRMLIIDDEADQASINTATMSEEEKNNRSRINQLIVRLANGKNNDDISVNFQAVNYLAFTATPYANVLNEAGRESLYPKDFVLCLPENSSYFGAKVIWGSKKEENYPGMDIVRKISVNDVKTIRKIGKGYVADLPGSFIDSFAWFLCCVAYIRSKGTSKKPISMLIHTVTNTQEHFRLFEKMKAWFNDTRSSGELLSRCRQVYAVETMRFTRENFENSFCLYENMKFVDECYLSFEEIEEKLKEILENDVKSIKIEDDGELAYSDTGIHMCVDNCSASWYGEEDTHLRIVYPTSEQIDSMGQAPAFIIIGGNTLSRGLTIEGLVSTYFSRSSWQADSLTQMARWYGYRKGYELLPRIWMSDDSIEKYKLLEEIDEKLRKTLSEYKMMGRNPSKEAPPVMNTSVIARFLLTGRGRAQNMIPCSMDYSSDSYELTEFIDDNNIIRDNLNLTEGFLLSIGRPSQSVIYPDTSLVWRNVESAAVLQYIRSYKTVSPSNFASQMNDFCEWMEAQNGKGVYQHWNVAVCGVPTYSGRAWDLGDNVLLGKVERTRKRAITDVIDIGSLRSGRDGICDIESYSADNSYLVELGRKGKHIEMVRSKLGYADIPLLLVYCIDHQGGRENGNNMKLGTTVDVASYAVVIGGDLANSDHVESVRVRLPEENENEDDL